MRFFGLALFVAAFVAAPAAAQSERSERTARNGVVVTVYSDDFASRYEYSAPPVESGEGFILVSRVRQGTTVTPIRLVGSVIYSSPWRFYSSAVFQGGAPADFTSTRRDVGRCSGGRYSSGCTLTEGFAINITPAQLRQHAVNGNIALQIRGRAGGEIVFTIPLSYFAAVEEVSQP
jgi:hypothetical protein